MMHKTPQNQSNPPQETKKHILPHTKLPKSKMAKVNVSVKLLKLMFLSFHCPLGFSAHGCMYDFDWEGLELSLI